MMPTGWGWLTILFGIAFLISCFYWGRAERKKPGVILALPLMVLLLFSFMQWVSWYK